jgi:hypothetical protein
MNLALLVVTYKSGEINTYGYEAWGNVGEAVILEKFAIKPRNARRIDV